MFTVCVGLVQLLVICSLQNSININTVELTPLRFTAYLHSETQEYVCPTILLLSIYRVPRGRTRMNQEVLKNECRS